MKLRLKSIHLLSVMVMCMELADYVMKLMAHIQTI